MVIMKYRIIMFNNSLYISLSQFVAILLKSFILKFCTVTSTKDTHQIPKNLTSVAESLIEVITSRKTDTPLAEVNS